MKQNMIALILLLMALVAAKVEAEYIYDLRASADPGLYRELYNKSQANIQFLPPVLRKQYRKLLKNHPDLLMNFLIAYEPSGKLAQAEPSDILANYHEIILLTRQRPMDYTLKFFLSYIAKQTITDERINPYRKIFLDDGLRELMAEAEDDLDLYRRVSLWCVERLKFQPTSGRDQTPLDITQRSLLGRCEEMQILFVAACRTVGIPSRPASVSWWAHIDNNHAWAEVFLDGKWYYTGDMDTAYHPNQAWFSGLVDKTVMVFASGTMADESDEVLNTDTYGSLINSIVHYSEGRSRMLHLRFVDAEMKPLPRTAFAVMVYNWGQLRPLTHLRSAEDGTFGMRVGRGAFYISALFKNDNEPELRALHLIPSSDDAEIDVTIVLKDSHFDPQDVLLEYPANEVDWKQTPLEWTQAANAAKERWQSRVDGFISVSPPEFADPLVSHYTALLHKCRMNQSELLAFTRANHPLDSDFVEFMADFDDKFFWQADRNQWEALYRFYLSVKRIMLDLPPREQYYLLSPTVHFEELPQAFRVKGKPALYPAFFNVRATEPTAAIRKVINKLSKKHKIDTSKALDGLLSLDAALKQKYLTGYQYKILCVSALRANGIPADYTRIPDVINIFLDGKWQYYDVVRNDLMQASEKESAKRNIILYLADEFGETLRPTDEQINMTMLRGGLFFPLNQKFTYREDGAFHGEFDGENLYLQIGYRSSDSMTGLQIIPIAADAPDPQNLHLTLRHYPRRWKEAEDWIQPLLRELENYQVSIFVIGNYNTENCVRLAQRLQEMDMTFLWLGHEPYDMKLIHYLVSATWQGMISEQPGLAYATLTLIRDTDGKWQIYQGIWENLPQE